MMGGVVEHHPYRNDNKKFLKAYLWGKLNLKENFDIFKAFGLSVNPAAMNLRCMKRNISDT